ncbi:YgcG family protein [Granulicella sp. S156]|uniref:TPM domain-containing protein n=1 Tax=Granulicella sp. S156 TaxID=1747224 RepID=UPI00131BD3C2|nr:TPM domain-containing protein [Granulicella sp. S156]
MNKQPIFCKFFGVVLFLAIAAGSVCAESPDKLPRPTSYVSDFAGVVDAGSKQSLEGLCKETFEKAHATIEIVTIKSLDGLTIEDFTTQLDDKWKVGPKGSDKGIVMVFAIKEHKRRIEVGYGLEGILNDAKVGDIGRSMVPQLQKGQYGPAILSGAQQIAAVIAADAAGTIDTGVTTAPAVDPVDLDAVEIAEIHRQQVLGNRIMFGMGALVFLFIAGMVVLVWRQVRLRGHSSRGSTTGSSGSSDSSESSSSSSSESSSSSDFDSGFGGGSGGGGASGDW